MALDLEYLDEAVVEAAAAAEWYTARSATAAAGFEAELDEAASATRPRGNDPASQVCALSASIPFARHHASLQKLLCLLDATYEDSAAPCTSLAAEVAYGRW